MLTPIEWSRPAPSMPGFHDPWPGTGDDHPPGLGHPLGETRRSGRTTGRRGSSAPTPKIATFRDVRYGSNVHERVAHLRHRGVRHLEVERVRPITDQAEHLGHELLGDAHVLGDAELLQHG